MFGQKMTHRQISRPRSVFPFETGQRSLQRKHVSFVRPHPPFERGGVHLLDGCLALPVHDVDPSGNRLHERAPDLGKALLKSACAPILCALLDLVRSEEKFRLRAGESARGRVLLPMRNPYEATVLELIREAVMDDPPPLRESVRNLLQLDFDTLLVGDGEPILEGAKVKLKELVESFPA